MGNAITVRFGKNRRIEAHCDDFVIQTDQSVKNGGDASAPEPYDLFLASLAACAGVYVRAFCAERDIPSEAIEIVQSWERANKKLSRVTIEIVLPPGFPEKYRAAVVRAANQCAVKKTLEAPPELVTRAVFAAQNP